LPRLAGKLGKQTVQCYSLEIVAGEMLKKTVVQLVNTTQEYRIRQKKKPVA